MSGYLGPYQCTFQEEYENYKSLIDTTNQACYLLKEQQQYVAFIHVSIRTDYVEGAVEWPVGYIEALYAKPACQNRGIGKKLVTLAQQWSQQKGCKQLASDTELTNTASIEFHQQIGFQEANRIVCFIKDV